MVDKIYDIMVVLYKDDVSQQSTHIKSYNVDETNFNFVTVYKYIAHKVGDSASASPYLNKFDDLIQLISLMPPS